MIGKTLAHYKVTAHIGTGGMGEVYRAHDEKLNREVALKALPLEFSGDPERVARFEREATTLAKLQHNNIATIYGLERDQDRIFLVMELAEGEDLAERLKRGPIPVQETIELAAQIAEGLEAAHALGIVHRDLKPANIMVTPAGDVKLLDFGLARAYADEGGSGSSQEILNSPTITAGMTAAGVILGTAAYMSPEQARGKTLDRQADIWAFGVVLYEMLTGDRLFGGETVSDSIGAILHRDPDLGRLPQVPSQVETLLRRCLARDKRERLRDIGDARLELADARFASAAQVADKGRGPAGRVAWLVAAVAVVAAAVLGYMTFSGDRSGSFTRAALGIPRSQVISVQPGSWGRLRFAPDGRTILHAGGDDHSLFLRDIQSFSGVPVPGTEQVNLYEFSPDGLWIAYTANSKLWKVALSGGAPVEICETAEGPGLAWAGDEIYFSRGNGGGLWSVSAGGGEPRQISTLDTSREETSHRWPHVLPDGRHLLFTIKTARIPSFDDALIGLLSLDTGEIKVLIQGGMQPRYSDTGHIIYGRGSQLFAVPFDLATLTVQGTPFMVVDQVRTMDVNGAAQYTLSPQGSLAFIPAEEDLPLPDLVWMYRSGRVHRLEITDPNYYEVSISPDGTKLAGMVPAANDKIHIFDLKRQTMTRLTNTPGNDGSPIWSPDGSQIAYANDRNGPLDLYVIPADGSAPARLLLASEWDDYLNCWTPDGSGLLFTRVSDGGEGRIWMVPADGSGEPEPLFEGNFSTWGGQISPDGRWLAYGSDVSGEANVFVRPYQRPGNSVRLSIDGGYLVRWAPDGKTIYFLSQDAMRAASVTTDPELVVGDPMVVFDRDEAIFGAFPLDPDGERFLAYRHQPGLDHQYVIRVIPHWAAGQKALRP